MLRPLLQLVGMTLLIGLVLRQSSIGQKPPADTGGRPSKQNLKLVTIGEAVSSSGHRGGFRVYSSADGGDADVTYFHFDSAGDAKHQAEQWRKLVWKITSKEQKRDPDGRVIVERIVGMSRGERPGKGDFLIVRRNGLTCYLIRSASLAVATQVEQLIKTS